MSTIVRNDNTDEFTFFLNKSLNITNSTSCDSFINDQKTYGFSDDFGRKVN